MFCGVEKCCKASREARSAVQGAVALAGTGAEPQRVKGRALAECGTASHSARQRRPALHKETKGHHSRDIN